MMKRFLSVAIVLIISAGSVLAQALDMQAAIPADPKVRVGKLDNGLTYYIRANAKPEKQAEFYIFHNVGAIQEEDSQIGLAHFLEHMAFNGTKNFPDKGILNYLEKIGVKFGYNLNAGTGQDLTVYNISSVPLLREGIVDSALLILHDWSYFISLVPSEIDKERGVIIEEYRTGNDANQRMRDKTAPALFNNSKYAKRNVIGTPEALKSFSHQELVDFYHRWYRTDMQAIVVVGDFDVDVMEAKVKKIMADIPKVENPAPKVPVMIPDNNEPLVSVVTDPELTRTTAKLYIKRQPLPDQMNDKVIAAKINTILAYVGTIANYRLEELSKKPNAPFVNAGLGQGAITSTADVLMAQAQARDGEAAKAFEAVYQEVAKIGRFGFTQSEFERAQSDLNRMIQSQYDARNDKRSNDYVWKYINNFRKNEAMPSAEVEYKIDSALLATTTLAEINAVVKQLITDQNQVAIITAPEKAGVSVPTEDQIKQIIATVRASELEAYVDNTVKEPLIDKPLKGSKVVKTEKDIYGSTVWTLGNGVKVVVKPTDFKADQVLVSATSDGGTSLLSDQDYASGSILPALVEMSGVGKFSATDLSKQLAGTAFSMSPVVSGYQHGLSGGGSPKDFEKMLQLAYLYFTSPRFAQEDYNVMLDQYKAALANAQSNPRFIFQDSIMNTAYGHNPRRQITSLKTLDKLSYEAMPRIYNTLFSDADDFTFKIVGNVDLNTIQPLVEKYIGSLPSSKAKATWRDDKAGKVKGLVENRFGVPMQTPKTTVMYIYSGDLPYNTENDMTLDALKQVLSIRYVESVREEKGGTYGVGVSSGQSIVPKQTYTLQISFDTDPAMADELMEIVVAEIKKIADEGVTSSDLGKVREYLIKQRPDDLKKNETWNAYISEYYAYGVDMNKDYDKILQELSSDKIKKLAAKVLADGNLIKVIMDPKK